MDLGFRGLIIESHCDPNNAWSDAKQQITPGELDNILKQLLIRNVKSETESLDNLQYQIDECDNQIIEMLVKRIHIIDKIGIFKKEHNMTPLQTERYKEILDKHSKLEVLCDIDKKIVKQIFEIIHNESIRKQFEMMNK